MESEAGQNDPCVRSVTVEIPWEVVEKERRDYIKGVRKTATVPGFRKGRVPEVVLYRYFEKEISVALTERLAPEVVNGKIASMDHKLASGPYISDFRFAEGQPFEVDAQFEVFPPFELGEYRNLKVLHEAEAITDERVDEELERLRGRLASARTVDPRPVQENDLLRVTFSARENGPELPFFGKELTCDLSREQTPGAEPFTRELPGLEAGEEAEISCHCPDDYPDPDLAGSTVKCNVTVHSILELDVPDLDDEFAKDLNRNHDTLDELKTALREELKVRFDMESRAVTELEVMSQLAASHQFELPRQHFQERLQRLAESMQARGDSPEPPSLTTHMIAREAMTVCAEQVLDRIADVEDIDLTREEIQGFINQWAESEQLTPESARQQMLESGALASIRVRGRRSKALQLVVDCGKPAVEQEARDPDEAGEQPGPALGSSEDK